MFLHDVVHMLSYMLNVNLGTSIGKQEQLHMVEQCLDMLLPMNDGQDPLHSHNHVLHLPQLVLSSCPSFKLAIMCASPYQLNIL